MNRMRALARAGGLLALLVMTVAAGCSRPAPALAPPKPPEVVFATPTVRDDVVEYEEFTGRTEASLSVELRARVTGYLKKAPFKEGSDVKKDDLLFLVDPSTYKAEVERLQAQVEQSTALLDKLNTEYRRTRGLTARNAASREELDKISGDRSQAEASVGAARAALTAAKLRLGFTEVKAPFSGRVSRRYSDPGNLVKADDTVLTTLVRLDPIHAYFDIDERTVLRLRKLIQQGAMRSAREVETRVDLGLADEASFSLRGKIDFVDNRLDPGTGTLRIRVEVENPRRLLSPGMFLRMRLPVSLPKKGTLMVPEQALVSDQGRKFVYVVEKKRNDKGEEVDVAVRRDVKTGQLQEGQRIIRDGLSPRDRVVLEGQQRLRDKAEVTPSPHKDPNRPAVASRQSLPPEL
jgi:RND family efflux transporter MFP subunit